DQWRGRDRPRLRRREWRGRPGVGTDYSGKRDRGSPCEGDPLRRRDPPTPDRPFMDDIPKARGTKLSSTAAASRYAFEASHVRFVRRIHSSDSRKVSSERFIEPPGISAPMMRFTTDIQMLLRDIDGMCQVNIDVYFYTTELVRPKLFINLSSNMMLV